MPSDKLNNAVKVHVGHLELFTKLVESSREIDAKTVSDRSRIMDYWRGRIVAINGLFAHLKAICSCNFTICKMVLKLN